MANQAYKDPANGGISRRLTEFAGAGPAGEDVYGETMAVHDTAPTSISHTGTAVADTAVSLTLAAVANKKHYVPRVVWSYSAAPTGGRLTITDDGATVFDIDIIAGGPGAADVHLESAVANKALVITLAAAGGAVVGKLNCPGAYTN